MRLGRPHARTSHVSPMMLVNVSLLVSLHPTAAEGKRTERRRSESYVWNVQGRIISVTARKLSPSLLKGKGCRHLMSSRPPASPACHEQRTRLEEVQLQSPEATGNKPYLAAAVQLR